MKTHYSTCLIMLLIVLFATPGISAKAHSTKISGSKISGAVVDEQQKSLDHSTVNLLLQRV